MRAVLFAIFIWLASQAFAQEGQREQPVEPSPTQEQSAEQPPIEAEPVVPEITPAEPARSEHDGPAAEDGSGDAADGDQVWWYGDTPAQWLMAATGIAAFFLSAWAVWLLYATLKATRKMITEAERTTKAAEDAVAETRRIGEAQVRAYIAITEVSLTVSNDDRPVFDIKYINSGNSPATRLELDLNSQAGVLVAKNEADEAPEIFQIKMGVFPDDLPSGASFSYPLRGAPLNAESKQAIQGPISVRVVGTLRYRTVFGQQEMLVIDHSALASMRGQDRLRLIPTPQFALDREARERSERQGA